MFQGICRTWRILVIVAVGLALAAGAAQAQSTATHVKTFEIISVDGNVVVVKEADGAAHEYTLPADFRFKVGSKEIPVQELKPGMKGQATITTTTTVKAVYVTEVKNGVVMKNLGAGSVIVRTKDGIKMFSQSQIDKRGIRLYREGHPVMVADLRAGEKLTATFVTEGPPQVMTEKEVQATLAAAPPPAAPSVAATPAASSATTTAAAAAPASATPAAPAATTSESAPAEAPAATAAPTAAPAVATGAPEAAAGPSYLIWGGVILLIVIVAFFLFRRSGD
jgi:hypothetical protein